MRELFVSALREWMAARGARNSVRVGALGKGKTAVQMAAVTPLLAARQPHGMRAVASGRVLAGAAVLAVVSAVGYVRRAMPALLDAGE